MIKKRNRKELYDKFRQGAIPSGADFADFIRSQVNLLDDGLDISDDPEEPINIRAKGEDENLLDFSDPVNRKRWRISGRSQDLAREGINIKADDRTNLFIERESGSIGIDTDQPEAKLHIKQMNAPDAIRIDDEGNDNTPFVITSEGKVGVGIGKGTDRPSALLHVNNPGAVDTLLVGDKDDAKHHLKINSKGDISMGFADPNPKAKLAVDGAVTIGSNTADPGSDGLYVKGDVRIDGNIVFSDKTTGGGIELKGNLKATGDDVVINDNVRIVGDDQHPGSKGNLFVEGDTTLGTFDSNNRLVVNGHITSGFDPDPQSSDIQPELVINDILSINRENGNEMVRITGPLDVEGTSNLGNNSPTDEILLNGTVRRDGTDPVTIDHNLTAKKNAILGDSSADQIYLNGTISSSQGSVIINDSLNINDNLTVNDHLTVNGNSTLGNSNSDSITLNGTIKSDQGSVLINDSLTINTSINVKGSATLGDATTDEVVLNGTVKSNQGDVIVGDNMRVTGTFKFDNGHYTDKIVNTINNNDSRALVTENAAKAYMDSKYNTLNSKIFGLVRDIRYVSTTHTYAEARAWGRGIYSYVNIYPPSGYSMSQLVFYAASPAWIPFAGGVDGNDTMRCHVYKYSSYFRVYVGNSEQRHASQVGWYALWKT